MKFKIMKYDDEEFENVSVKNKPFDNAYSENWVEYQKTRISTFKTLFEPILIYDDNNKPKAEIKKNISYDKPPDWWFSIGKNHKLINENDNIWQREIQKTDWYIDIDNLEQLREFCVDKVRYIQFDCDENVLIIW